MSNCFKDFPLGTVHIISVDDELSIHNEHLAVKAFGHYFIGADNGLFSLLFNEVNPERIVRLNISLTTNCMTFAAKNIFVPAACHLARGGTMEIIGTAINDFAVKKVELKAVLQTDIIRGAVVHIDSYGNAITNINKNELQSQIIPYDNIKEIIPKNIELISMKDDILAEIKEARVGLELWRYLLYIIVLLLFIEMIVSNAKKQR